MKRIVFILIVALFALHGYAAAIEEVLIDFALLTADTPADNPRHDGASLLNFNDLYPTSVGFSIRETERELVQVSLALPQWRFAFSSSSSNAPRLRTSDVRLVPVKAEATRYAGESVMGVRMNFDDRIDGWALIEPSYDIPRVPQELISGTAVDFGGRGVIERVDQVQSISIDIYGFNYPHRISVLYEDTTGVVRERMFQETLQFSGWRTLTWDSPYYRAPIDEEAEAEAAAIEAAATVEAAAAAVEAEAAAAEAVAAAAEAEAAAVEAAAVVVAAEAAAAEAEGDEAIAAAAEAVAAAAEAVAVAEAAAAEAEAAAVEAEAVAVAAAAVAGAAVGAEGAEGAEGGESLSAAGGVPIVPTERDSFQPLPVDYPVYFPNIAFRGFRIWKQGGSVTRSRISDFYAYIKEVRVNYDPLPTVEDDFNNEEIWGVLTDEARRSTRTRQRREGSGELYNIIDENINY